MSADRTSRRRLPRLEHVAMVMALSAFCAAQTLAQTRPAAPPPVQPPSPAPQDGHPPYEPQLLRLAQIIGALVYLRDLCGDNDGDKWRAKMADLLAGETNSEAERQRLAGAYNQGFHGYALTYRSCTPNAKLVIARYLDEGERLAHDVESSYGGG